MGAEFSTDLSEITFNFLDMPVITMLAEEGALTVVERRIGQSGARDKTHVLASEIQPGGAVIMDSTQDLTVKVRNLEQNILGFATAFSEPLEGIELPELLADGVTADPELFQITIEVLGQFARVVTLAAGATAVVPGDSVKLRAVAFESNWDKGTANNGTLVLSAASAGEDVAVVFGHDGVFS